MQDGPWSAAILRGALGHALAERARSDDEAASAFSLFHLSRVGPSPDLPRPIFPVVERHRATVHVEIRLFGTATSLADTVAQSLCRALDLGLALSPETATRVSIAGAETTRTHRETIDPPGPITDARLLLRTPLRLGGKHSIHARWPDFFRLLFLRLSGMARWQGFDLDGWRAVDEAARDVRVDDSGMIPIAWSRHSSAQGGRRIPMAGLGGVVEFRNIDACLLPLLAVAEVCGAGSRTALGLGRFELV